MASPTHLSKEVNPYNRLAGASVDEIFLALYFSSNAFLDGQDTDQQSAWIIEHSHKQTAYMWNIFVTLSKGVSYLMFPISYERA